MIEAIMLRVHNQRVYIERTAQGSIRITVGTKFKGFKITKSDDAIKAAKWVIKETYGMLEKMRCPLDLLLDIAVISQRIGL